MAEKDWENQKQMNDMYTQLLQDLQNRVKALEERMAVADRWIEVLREQTGAVRTRD